MSESQNHSFQTKLLLGIIGLLVVIIFLLLGWKITKVQFFGVELAPPLTSTIESVIATYTPTSSLEMATEIPTNAIVIENPVVTNTPSFVVRTECISSENIFLGKGFSGFMEEKTSIGAIKKYTHCPPISPIQYNDVTVDDNLDKVELVCENSTIDLTQSFLPLIIQGELLPHFQSPPLDVPNGCRIDFTVSDSKGVYISLKFSASGVP